MSGEVAEPVASPSRLSEGRIGEIRSSWVASGIALALIGAVLLVLHRSEAVGAVRVWYGSTAYNHGFLIIPIVVYLIWERRHLLVEATPQPCLWVAPLFLAVGIVWLVARLIGLLEAQQLLLIATAELALLAVLGWRVFRILGFPFLYLFFLVPTGEFLVPYLQDFTAHFSIWALRLTGVPVYSDGFLISIPNNNFYVAEACAGLRFLIATIAFGFLFADFAYRSRWRKLCFIAACCIAPIIANGLRAYGIILLAYLTDGHVAAGVDHILYGWIFFSIVTVAIMAIGWLFREDAPSSRAAPLPLGTVASRPQLLVAAAIVLFLVAIPHAYATYLERSSARLPLTAMALPQVTPPWAANAAAGDWHPDFPGADATALQRYRSGGTVAELYLAYYARQGEGKKLVGAANRLAGPEDGDVSNRSTVKIALDGEAIPAALTEFSSRGRKRVVLSVYWVDGQFVANPMLAKLLQAKAELLDGQRAAAIIAISTERDFDAEAEAAVLVDFGRSLRQVRQSLAATSGQ
jgi:exosortase A